MYLLPVINGRQADRQQTEVFGGLNRSFAIRDNEFSDMLNMSGDDYPYIAVRRNRELMSDFTEDGEKLDLIITDYARESSYDKGTGIRVYDNTFDFYERGEKQNVPTKTTFEKANGETFTLPMQNEFAGLIRFGNNVIKYPNPEVVNYFGEERSSLWLGKFAHGYNIENSQYSREIFSLKGTGPKYNLSVYCYNNSYKNFRDFPKVGMRLRFEEYTKIGGEIIRNKNDFGAVYFVVESVEEYNKTTEQQRCTVKGYRYDGTELEEEINYTLQEGSGLTTGMLITQVNVDANLLSVHQNRLWGTDTLGTSIYCSNATDFYDWEIDGTAAGGGYLDVPENTPWTAICEYAGYLYAFKENKMYKIMGSNSLDYSIIQLADVGCTNQEAVCVCDSILYFLSRDGVYAFYGSQPTCVSEVLPGEYKRGVFASRGQKLYASIERMDGVKEFLVYDSAKRVWHKEDDFSVVGFVDYTDGLYALSDNKDCYKLEAVAESSDMPFSITTKKYFYIFDQKAVSSANLYLDMGEGSSVTVQISYDGGEFVTCGTFGNRRLKHIPIRLRKCDEFQIRIMGNGFIRLKQMEFVLHSGGRTIR